MKDEREIVSFIKGSHAIRLTDRRLAIDLTKGIRSTLESLVEGHESLRHVVGWALRFAYPEDVPIDRIVEAHVTLEGAVEILRKTPVGLKRVRVPELTGEDAHRLVSEIAKLKRLKPSRILHRSVMKLMKVGFTRNEWILVILGFMLLWEVIAQGPILPEHLLPSPSKIAAVMFKRAIEITGMVLLSYRNLVLGIILAAFMAIPLAFTSALKGKIDFTLSPMVMLLYSLPDLALLPIIVYWTGHGALGAILMCAIVSFSPIYFTVREGAKAIPVDYFEAVRIFGGDRLALLKELVFPGSWPSIVTGFRLAFSYCWQIVLAIEMIALVPGIGLFIEKAVMVQNPELDTAFAGMFAVGIVVVITDRMLLLKLEERIGRWRG